MIALVFAAVLGTTVFCEENISPTDTMGEEEVVWTVFMKEKQHRLCGIVIQSPDAAKDSIKGSVEGIEERGLQIPGGADSLARFLGPDYFDCSLTDEKLKSLKDDVIRYYRAHHHPFVAVEIPEQEIAKGFIRITVAEGKLEKTICTGNKWVSDEQILSAVPIEAGQSINTDRLLNSIAWFNRNPFHRTDLLFMPGEFDEGTILELSTKDRFPLRPYVGADNTGVSNVVGRARVFGGFNLSNAFELNDVLSFQYTAAPDFSELQSFTLHHTIPLPWKHLIIIYGGYSSSNPDSSQFSGIGHSGQASGRYTIPILPLYGASMRELTIGFDWKYTNNNLQYVDFSPYLFVGGNTNIGQFMAGFDYGDTFSIHKFSFSAQLFASFGHFLPHQTDHDYQRLRYKAKSSYIYGRLSVGDMMSLPYQCTLATLLRLQFADANLLPSEEFGLGGYDTVRGYDERELNADNAVCANLEFYMPPIKSKNWGRQELKFLAFLDYGLGNHVQRMPGEPFTRYLMGVGGGLRYSIGEYFMSRLDWGFKLHQLPFGDTSLGKLHVGAVLSY